MDKTIKDLVKSNDDELSFGGYTIDMLECFAKAHIKRLRRQEKLHWKFVASSVGENPSCVLPRGFDYENSLALPFGYKDVIRWIQRAFNLEVDKDEGM